MRDKLFPSNESEADPGPVRVMSCEMNIWPLVNDMVAGRGRLKLIVSPLLAAARASRKRQPDPGQFVAFAAPSVLDCTVQTVAACAG